MTVLAVTSPSIIPMELSYQHVIAVVSLLLRNHSRRAPLQDAPPLAAPPCFKRDVTRHKGKNQ